ncbi:MAG: response regulator transcription factor [Actinomycetota bacterium]
MANILVAEDEPEIADFLVRGLRGAGHEAVVAVDGPQALASALSGTFDLVLLDVGLPGLDGFSVLRSIREQTDTLPVIVLTARSGVADTVVGLDAGATDYVSKPFRIDELLARIRRGLREADRQPLVVLSWKGLSLDLRTHRGNVDGRTIELSAREFALAEELMRHPGTTLSRQHLLSTVWGFKHDPGSNILEVYVSYLRDKLGAARIETVRGLGYRMA